MIMNSLPAFYIEVSLLSVLFLSLSVLLQMLIVIIILVMIVNHRSMYVCKCTFSSRRRRGNHFFLHTGSLDQLSTRWLRVRAGFNIVRKWHGSMIAVR